MMQTTCSAPAKLILSGEHAVLYQCPALSLAVQLYSQCQCQHQADKPNNISIELTDFQQQLSFPNQDWQTLAQQIEQRYQQFLDGQLAIHQVLQNPVDLVLVTLLHFQQEHTIAKGSWHFKIQSNIPIGRGLGSSASIIVSLLKALYKQHQIESDLEQQLALAKKIESRQHGKSSGIDPATILHGGLLEYRLEQPLIKHTVQAIPAWLIDTGAPQSSTGQAVSSVEKHFAHHAELWQAFSNTAQQIILAWQNQDSEQFLQQIEYNQQLLNQIGVVPEKVQQFITELQQNYSASAKICGSGAVQGDSAGVILCFSEQPPKALCEQYGYSYQAINIDLEGATCQ